MPPPNQNGAHASAEHGCLQLRVGGFKETTEASVCEKISLFLPLKAEKTSPNGDVGAGLEQSEGDTKLTQETVQGSQCTPTKVAPCPRDILKAQRQCAVKEDGHVLSRTSDKTVCLVNKKDSKSFKPTVFATAAALSDEQRSPLTELHSKNECRRSFDGRPSPLECDEGLTLQKIIPTVSVADEEISEDVMTNYTDHSQSELSDEYSDSYIEMLETSLNDHEHLASLPGCPEMESSNDPQTSRAQTSRPVHEQTEGSSGRRSIIPRQCSMYGYYGYEGYLRQMRAWQEAEHHQKRHRA